MSHAVYEDMLMKFVSLLFAAALTAHATVASPLPPPPVLPYNGPLRPVGTVSAFGASTWTTWRPPSRIRPTVMGR